MRPRPREDPAWYQSKACFYVFNFVVEIIVIFLYVAVRVDQRFWVPNNSHAAGDYSRKNPVAALEEKIEDEASHGGIMSEEEVFDDQQPFQESTGRSKDEERAVEAAV